MLFWIKEKCSIGVPSISQSDKDYQISTDQNRNPSRSLNQHGPWLPFESVSGNADSLKLILIPFALSDWKKVPKISSPTQSNNHVFLEKNYFQPRFSLFWANNRNFKFLRENFAIISHFHWHQMTFYHKTLRNNSIFCFEAKL